MKAKAVTALLVALLLARLLPLWQSTQAAACSSTAVGSFTCVQSFSGLDATATNPTYVMTSNVTSGTKLLGFASWIGVTLNSVSGCGATWTLLGSPVSGAAAKGQAFYGTGGSGACTVTLNFSLTSVSGAVIHEINGGDATDTFTSRFSVTACDACGTGTDAATSGAVTASGTDYIFGATVDLSGGNLIDAGTGYTIRERQNSIVGAVSSEDKSASGSNNATFTNVGNNYNLTGIISYKVAASAGTRPSSFMSLLGVGK